MQLRERIRFDELKNMTEDLVLVEMERQMGELSAELPEDALLDIAALALNALTPHYRVNLLGRIYLHAFEEEHKSEVERAVKDAILKISENPPPV